MSGECEVLIREGNQKIRRSNSLRAGNYDYRTPGWYFVTICTEGQEFRFGRIAGVDMILNPAGLIIVEQWQELANRFHYISLDDFVVMPNHLHGIIIIREDGAIPDSTADSARVAGTSPGSLSRVIQAFKSITTRSYSVGVRECGWRRFNRRLWQRSFYDHIIRDECDLDRIRTYIRNNPAKWYEDHENPARTAH